MLVAMSATVSMPTAAAFTETRFQKFGPERRTSFRRDDLTRQHASQQFDMRVIFRSDSDLPRVKHLRRALLQEVFVADENDLAIAV